MSCCVLATGHQQCERPRSVEEEGEGVEERLREGAQAAREGTESAREAGEASSQEEEEVEIMNQSAAHFALIVSQYRDKTV